MGKGVKILACNGAKNFTCKGAKCLALVIENYEMVFTQALLIEVVLTRALLIETMLIEVLRTEVHLICSLKCFSLKNRSL